VTIISRLRHKSGYKEVVDTLRYIGWSFKQFLLAWVRERASSQDILLEHRQYRTMQQRRELVLGIVTNLNKSHPRYTFSMARSVQELAGVELTRCPGAWRSCTC